MSIINIFNFKKELFSIYPKQFYFQLKDIFNDYWYDFLVFANSRNLIIRPVVSRDIERMTKCRTSAMGYSLLKCPNCNTVMIYETGYI